MTRRDLTSKQVKPLQLTLGDRSYTVRPPSARTGELMMRAVILGSQAMTASQAVRREGGTEEEATAAAVAVFDDQRDSIQDLADDPEALQKLALGDVWEEMHEADLPSADIRMAGQYAVYFWVYGPKAADRIVFGDDDESADGGDEDVPKLSKTGPDSESQEQSAQTAHSPDTTSPSESGSGSVSARPEPPSP